MARPSTNVTIFSETPKPITALPTEVQTGGYQNNQVITAGEYNMMMSTIQKWVNYLDEERKSGLTKDTTHDTEIATLKTRATSLETSRNNRMGEIITTLSDIAPPDCLPCDGSQVPLSSYPELLDYYKNKSNIGYSLREHHSLSYPNGGAAPILRWGHLFYNETSSDYRVSGSDGTYISKFHWYLYYIFTPPKRVPLLVE